MSKDPSLDIKKVINDITSAATLYKNNLLNKNLMFIYTDKQNHFNFIEAVFLKSNFLHLTGIEYKSDINDLENASPAETFFNDCIDKKLSSKNIIIPKNKTNHVKLKLSILSNAMSIAYFANSIGEYNGKSGEIGVEKVIGNTSIVFGFSNVNEYGNELRYYFPRSLLKDSIYTNSIKNMSYNIVGVLSKNKKDEAYSEICKLKGIDVNFLFNNQEIADRIDFSKLYSKNDTLQKLINQFFNDFKKIEEENKLLYDKKLDIDDIVHINEETKLNENYTEFDKHMEEIFDNTLYIEDLGDLYYIYDKVKNKNNFEKVVKYLDNEIRAKDIYSFNIRKIEEKQNGEEM